MSREESGCPFMSRRKFLAATAGSLAAATASSVAAPLTTAPADAPTPTSTVPFYGQYQAGILTRAQSNTYFATFDITTTNREELTNLLRTWTTASAAMTQGQPAAPLTADPSVPANDSGDTLGLSPSRLTLTFGLGPTLFTKNNQDRFGLASRRPAALIDLPRFASDQLIDAKTGGDLSIQACADDPQVAFHAIRQLARLAYGTAEIRWTESGFLGNFGPKETPRNLMGFKDGTGNPSVDDPALMNQFVWADTKGPQWMTNGTYAVVRRIRMALEHWDRMNLSFQEQAVGRQKQSGAGLANKNEFDPVDLDATDKDGNSIVPDNSHVRLAMPASNDGARILRRSYNYNDGTNFTAERWPPWRQAMEYDAGLLFICYQKDIRTGFAKIFDQMSKIDMMNQFVTHNGSAVFACPPGIALGQFIAQSLFD